MKDLKVLQQNYLIAKANYEYVKEIERKIKEETLKRYEYFNEVTGNRLTIYYEDFLMSEEAFDDYCKKLELVYNELYQKQFNKKYKDYINLYYGDELHKAEKDLINFAPKFLMQFGKVKEANIFLEAIKNKTLSLKIKDQLINLTLKLSI